MDPQFSLAIPDFTLIQHQWKVVMLKMIFKNNNIIKLLSEGRKVICWCKFSVIWVIVILKRLNRSWLDFFLWSLKIRQGARRRGWWRKQCGNVYLSVPDRDLKGLLMAVLIFLCKLSNCGCFEGQCWHLWTWLIVNQCYWFRAEYYETGAWWQPVIHTIWDASFSHCSSVIVAAVFFNNLSSVTQTCSTQRRPDLNKCLFSDVSTDAPRKWANYLWTAEQSESICNLCHAACFIEMIEFSLAPGCQRDCPYCCFVTRSSLFCFKAEADYTLIGGNLRCCFFFLISQMTHWYSQYNSDGKYEKRAD